VLIGGVGGASQVLGAGLFSFRLAQVLPLPVSSPLSLLFPLEKGQQCCLVALHDANSCLHDRCGLLLAMLAMAFQLACLIAQFLFCASCLFSFRARVAAHWPLVRSKKA
jgi:hypothetical protein